MHQIISYAPEYRSALLNLSLRAWEPVFPVVRNEVPGFVYGAFYPNGWRVRQLKDLSEVLDNEPENVDVAVDEGRPIGWVCTRLHPDDNMGEVFVIAVDPDYQQRGVGRHLLEHAFARVREAGMAMVMVETGGDSGHAPARRVYESLGFEPWPVARYFKQLDR
ncbi:GNAT family N-acetyltransferase [Dietzia cinnamea]|uniref:GNAT family N-acetyltransferase n=1 Tax=Dietzia cinnamea TaxID=321318 RepID=A0ABV3YMH2_9ACTN